ncbi:hypothetical protein KR51_00016070 [Rubidibacter lacunae KORDI 51-2]|uniref:Uncharacterized protein n=1 Tax=Rubidibacter lacunae KORDI 51-2 TaxID=582515 RepID=U5DB36_9CHRO|nr:hypothetical protein [Rubidibacter lacunae]ERN41758.1 hypothetical protein KR51_00016070 [Rubidibacter lacunae KORDI 51-2]
MIALRPIQLGSILAVSCFFGITLAVALLQAKYVPSFVQRLSSDSRTTTTALARPTTKLAEYVPPEGQKPPQDDGSTTTA